MAVVLSLRWPGATPEQYEAVRDAVRWEEQVPEGLSLHVAWFDEGALHVTDVWDAQADFERFFAERLTPAVQEAGMPGEPEARFSPLHRRFVVPGVSGGA
ncbi:hypothetical protein [Streptomyces shaanxiensis]|uniref:ABM domain-containing protein n=1 Tax=Streptomyces shaanxiensis TaxID=653357 RepID=A0ABP7WAP5_9ACTN